MSQHIKFFSACSTCRPFFDVACAFSFGDIEFLVCADVRVFARDEIPFDTDTVPAGATNKRNKNKKYYLFKLTVFTQQKKEQAHYILPGIFTVLLERVDELNRLFIVSTEGATSAGVPEIGHAISLKSVIEFTVINVLASFNVLLSNASKKKKTCAKTIRFEKDIDRT